MMTSGQKVDENEEKLLYASKCDYKSKEEDSRWGVCCDSFTASFIL